MRREKFHTRAREDAEIAFFPIVLSAMTRLEIFSFGGHRAHGDTEISFFPNRPLRHIQIGTLLDWPPRRHEIFFFPIVPSDVCLHAYAAVPRDRRLEGEC